MARRQQAPNYRPKPALAEIEALRGLVQTFVRSFGLLVTKETPCGQPVSPSHAHALMVLVERAQQKLRTSQSDLGLALGIDKSNVARLCARMEAAGHVAQERADGDGRSRIVTLSAAGTRLGHRIAGASRERFGRVVRAIPPSKRHAVFESLRALNEAVETLRKGDESHEK